MKANGYKCAEYDGRKRKTHAISLATFILYSLSLGSRHHKLQKTF